MGMFSGKKKIYVSSVTYPLGEDGTEDTGSLRKIVTNSILQGQSLSASIQSGYLKGQGMALRNAFRYARDHYTHGVPKSAAQYLDQPDTTLITPLVQPQHPGATILYLTTVVGPADHEWWAEQHLTKEYGYDRATREFARPPVGVDFDANVAYDLEPGGLIRILLMNDSGATTVLDYRPTGWEPMATFLHCAYRARQTYTTLDQTSTRAATPGEVDSVTSTVTTVVLAGETQVTVDRVEVDVTGASAVVKHTITTEITSRPQYLLYKLGSGTYPTLDAWLSHEDLESAYFPSVPLRVNNVNLVTEARENTELYKTSDKLLRKIGCNLEKLGRQVNTNPSVGDIDFAFVVFGVSLNNKSQEAKRYLYRYFEHLRGITAPGATKGGFNAWALEFATGTVTTPPPINAVQIYSEVERDKNHDVKLQWDYIDTTLKTGTVFPGAKIGDVEIAMGDTVREFEFGHLEMVVNADQLYARRQLDANTYEELEISGLIYENFIYKGKAVTITAREAMTDEDVEGFIIPLSQQIIRYMPLIELTDLSYQCCHMVFNCYKVVKQKWYETGLFKWIMVIIAVVLCIFFPPAGVTMLATLLGTYLVVAAIIYVAAMMLIMKLLLKLAVDVFGAKWGPIIMAIAMFVTMNWDNLGQVAAGTANFALTANLIIQASTVILGAYNTYAMNKVAEIQKKLMGLETEYDRKMKEIEELSKANLDTNTDLIDIYGMTQATNLQYESPELFFGRTLLTGGDVCDITASMIENFTEVGLALPTTG